MVNTRRAVCALIGTTAAVVAMSAGVASAKGGGGGGGGGGSSVSVQEFSQCANGGPPSTALDCVQWTNGILNSSNSHYSEDEVTPQRLALSVPAGGANHTVTIRYLDRKGSASAHAYDSLATWNVTQTAADPCQSLSAALCAGPPTTFPMASDPTNVPPAGPGISTSTAAHELPQASRNWTMYGGAITATSSVTHSAPNRPTTDDYAKVTITFHATAGNVLLLFGGHLAAGTGPRGWGAGLGAANISGGPYHIIVDSIDGASVGSRDNQIQASAILPGSPQFTITKTASPTTASAGDTVTYTITVTNTGTADGSTSFVDNFDDRLSPTLPVSTPTGGTCSREPSGTDRYFTCTTSLLAANGGTQTFTYSAVMPTAFTDSSDTTGCPTGSYAVRNTATLATGGSQTVTVCVTGSPKYTLVKSVNTTSANPGDTLTYTLTVTNTGSAPGSTTVTDDYDSKIDPSVPAGCQKTNGTLVCTTHLLNPGDSQTFTYTATLPNSFSGTPGTDGCGSTQFSVKNTATVVNGNSDGKTVCVNATPTFTVTKTGNPTSTTPGGSVTYTITVRNGGTAAGSTMFTDDYNDQVTLTSVPAGCTNVTTGNKHLECTTGTIPAGGQQVFTYTATMPASFTDDPDTVNCGPGQHSVINTVTLANQNSDDSIVCVNAAPAFTVTKSASPSTAAPGQTVTYTITVRNTGTAAGSTAFTDNYDDRLSPTVPNGCTADTVGGDKVLDCTTGRLNPGDHQTFTYTAAMPTTFTGFPGGFGCTADNPHQYPVRNVVVLAGGGSTSNTVCVTAAPNIHLVKSVTSRTDDSGNQYLTYTIAYSNTGPAEATLLGISDAVPAGTAYDSCTGGCSTVGSPASTVTWSVGPVAPLTGSGSVTFTVLVTATQQCSVSNTAFAQFDSDAPVASNTVVTNVSPKSNPAGAHASGSAIGAQVLSSGLIGVNTAPLSTASSSQSGVGGPQLNSQSLVSVAVPSNGALIGASALNTTSASLVTASPDEARQTSSAEVAHVCVVPILGICTVEADTVRAVASTTANGGTASYSSAGSTIQNLKVVGLATPVDLNQTTTINLNALVFGAGSYVAINERTGSAGLSSGAYKADLTVTMIHVKITGILGGLQAAEVIVARASAHSDFPQTFVCSGANNQSVSGHAYVASVATQPVIANVTQGYVQLPPLGGSESQHIVKVTLPADGSLIAAAAGDSSTSGSVTATQSASASQAELAGDNTKPACILRTATGCVVTAQVVHSEAHSTATSAGATSTDAGTSLVNVSVLGIPIAGSVAPNTVINLLGIGYLVLNEQFCDGGGLTYTHSCTGAHHSGITVRAVDLVVNANNNPLALLPGVQVVVAEAHSDATFGS